MLYLKPTWQLQDILERLWLPLLIVLLLAILTFVGIAYDLDRGTSLSHVIFQLLLVSGATSAILFLWLQLKNTLRKEHQLEEDLASIFPGSLHWQENQRDLLTQLSIAITRQFC